MYYKIPVTRDTICIMILAKKLEINAVSLFILYEKFKKEFFYFWYILAGFQNLPSVQELYTMFKSAERYQKETPKWLSSYIQEDMFVLNISEATV